VDITVTVISAWSVRLDATATNGTPTWTRTVSGLDDNLGAGANIIDRTAPLNTPILYSATDLDGTVVAAETVTLRSDKPVLSNPITGEAITTTVVAMSPLRWEGRSVAHRLVSSNRPRVSVAPMIWPEGDLTLYTANRDELNGVRSMMQPGEPLRMRSECPDTIQDLTMLVIDAEEQYFAPDVPTAARSIRIRFQTVDSEPTLYPPIPSWTYGDSTAADATYADSAASYPGYAALTAGPLP
jgi:hypothetical protein